MRAPALPFACVLTLAAVACSSFGSTNDAPSSTSDGGTSGSTPDGSTPDGGASAVTFLGSSYKPSADASGQIDIQPPSGAREGDLVLSLWNIASYEADLPVGFSSIGAGQTGVAANTTSYASIGYHVLGPGETDATHFTFTNAKAKAEQQLALVAFRGPRRDHPIGQYAIEVSLHPEPPATPDYTVTHPFRAIEPVVGKTVVAAVITPVDTSFPDLPGLKRVPLNSEIGLYRTEAPSTTDAFQPPPVTLTATHVEIRNVLVATIALDD